MKKWHAGDVVILPGKERTRATVVADEVEGEDVECVWFDRNDPQGNHRQKFKSMELRFPDDDGE